MCDGSDAHTLSDIRRCGEREAHFRSGYAIAVGTSGGRLGSFIFGGLFLLFSGLNVLIRRAHPHEHTEALGAARALVGTDCIVREASEDVILDGSVDKALVHRGDLRVIGKGGIACVLQCLVLLADGPHHHADHFHARDEHVRLVGIAVFRAPQHVGFDQCVYVAGRPVACGVGEGIGAILFFGQFRHSRNERGELAAGDGIVRMALAVRIAADNAILRQSLNDLLRPMSFGIGELDGGCKRGAAQRHEQYAAQKQAAQPLFHVFHLSFDLFS